MMALIMMTRMMKMMMMMMAITAETGSMCVQIYAFDRGALQATHPNC